jgi:hypothetical protein
MGTGGAATDMAPFGTSQPLVWAAAGVLLLVLGTGLGLLLATPHEVGAAEPTSKKLDALWARIREEVPDVARDPTPPVAPGSGDFGIHSPAGTTEATRPTFLWMRVPSAAEGGYEVVVRRVGVSDPVWKRAAEDTPLAYPGDLGPLEEGARYVVEVVAKGAIPKTARASFRVASREERDRIERAFGAIAERSEEPLYSLARADWAFQAGWFLRARDLAERHEAYGTDDPAGRALLRRVRTFLGFPAD